MAIDDAGDGTVRALVSDGLVEVGAGVTIREVAEQLVSEDVGAVVVVDEGRVHGLVSERDVVGAIAAGRDIDALRAADLDTRELVTCTPDTAILDAAMLMMEHYVRHLLVGDEGRPIGVISARDLLGALAM